MAKKLVIIDDSSTQLNILKTLFVNDGWEVCGVQSVKIGFEMIFDYAPDLIITDAIMPVMGGFQLLKMIRENEKISKIPVIVYSILNENNAKFYIKEELSEYFLRKDNNHDELLALARNIVQKYPLDNDYKNEILKIGLQNYKFSHVQNVQTVEETEDVKEIEKIEQQENIIENTESTKINLFEFEKNIESKIDLSFGDEKVLGAFFNELYGIMHYDLAVIDVYSIEDECTKTYFDIRDIILSPILRNFILNKFNSKQGAMYKKYAPNLQTVVNESEFLSKIEFNLKYKDKKIADLLLYSREKLKWEYILDLSKLEEILYGFFKARYIKRNSENSKQEENVIHYKKQVSNRFDGLKNNTNAYFAVVQISNLPELNERLSEQEMDVLNSKISEKIIEFLDRDEQIYKNDEDGYDVVIFAKDDKHANYRFGYILDALESVKVENNSIQIFIAASSCNIENTFNIIEAQKNVREILDELQHQEKVVIYNVGK